ncbi:MAG TPA: citrate/2-methylcitrate synthase [Aggregatilineales bacterium]|nr:citrate/2-methylcitrate synthase [Aggregatilineales bacterium]
MSGNTAVISKGLDNVIVGESKTSLVDGHAGKLIYCGYKIEDLAANALFEEVVYLLWHYRLPNRKELEDLRLHIAREAVLPVEVVQHMRQLPKDSNAMAVLRSVVSLLGIHDREGEAMDADAVRHKAVRLTGQITTACAAWARLARGEEPVAPKANYNLAENFVYMLTGQEPGRSAVDAVNVYLVLLAEHGMNASTFTSRVVTATGADFHSAIVAAIGALKGPSHGGANAEAMHQFLEIGEPENVEKWFAENIKSGKRRVMGIGHRVYKALDPRAQILKEKAAALAKESGNSKWYDIARKLDDLARADDYFISRNLYANVDYYSAIVLYTLHLPVDMFTPLFAMSRIAGWSAHVLEQMANNRLIRPDVNYVGPMNLEWQGVDYR